MFEFDDYHEAPRKYRKHKGSTGNTLLVWMLIVILFPLFLLGLFFIFGMGAGFLSTFK